MKGKIKIIFIPSCLKHEKKKLIHKKILSPYWTRRWGEGREWRGEEKGGAPRMKNPSPREIPPRPPSSSPGPHSEARLPEGRPCAPSAWKQSYASTRKRITASQSQRHSLYDFTYRRYPEQSNSQKRKAEWWWPGAGGRRENRGVSV